MQKPSSRTLAKENTLSPDKALKLYQKMLLVRRAEERIREEYFEDQMKTPVHLGIGEEAIPVGVLHTLPANAKFYGTYRNHALFLALTEDTDSFFGEMYGRASGIGKGKAGSMHLMAPEAGLMATSAVVGTTLPLAVGHALANQYQGKDDLVAVFFGDGAVEEGAFWESVNFASLRKLKILFICEDNGLAIHTPTAQRAGFKSIPEAVSGFHCHSSSADGSDLAAVVQASRTLLDKMSQDPKPGLLHLTYFRFMEHVGVREDFDAGYRRRPTPEEMERLDPVVSFERSLRESGVDPEAIKAIRDQVDQKIDSSIRSAQAAPFAPVSELETDLFVEEIGTKHQTQRSVPGATLPKPGEGGAKTMTFRDALALAMKREMECDPNVFVFGLDVPDHKRIFGSTQGLVEAFGPRRCFGTPLSEDAMTGAALGAALAGLRPVHVHIRADFMLLSMNQIVNMISNLRYMSGGQLKIPLVIRGVIGRGWGQSAQHSKTLHATLAHFPGLKVVLPTSAQDAYSLLRASIRENNPVIFLEHRWLYDVTGEVDESREESLGLPAVRRAGKDITIVAASWMNIEAMKAAEVLSKRGVEAEVIDVRTVTPLHDDLILDSVRKTKHCIVADYDWLFCGLSAELASRVAHGCFGELKKPVERVGFAPVPCPTTRPLENRFYPSAETIIRRVEQMLGLEAADFRENPSTAMNSALRGRSKAMRLYIAGHTGLVGSALVRHFKGCAETALITADRTTVDLLNPQSVAEFIKREAPDAIILAAGRVGGIAANEAQGAQFIYENLMIEANIIHGAWEAGVARLLNFGSSCMYPKGAPQPMRTEQLMTGPLEPTSAPYAIAKWAGMTLCEAYRRQYGARFTTAIPSTVYGPHDDFDPKSGHVLSALLARFHAARLNGQDEVVLWGTGSPKREFLYADDLAEACAFLLDRYDQAGPIHVGSGQVPTIRELAEAAAEVVGFSGRIRWDSTRPDGAPEKSLDLSEITRLGWSARTDLSSGLSKTYQWFLSQGQVPCAHEASN